MLIKNTKYSDIPFFLSKNSFTGDFNLVRDLSAVRQSVKNIILTRMSERPFELKFGASPYDLMFENLSNILKIEYQAKVAENIATFEPRVVINDIVLSDEYSLTSVITDPNTISMEVSFSIPDLGLDEKINIQVTRTR